MALALYGPPPVAMPQPVATGALAQLLQISAHAQSGVLLALVPTGTAAQVIQATCSGEPLEDTSAHLVALRNENSEAFKEAICNQILPSMLTMPHQCPRAAEVAIHTFVKALAGVEQSVIEASLQWLFQAQGGAGYSARDTSDRWRCAVLMSGLVQAAIIQGRNRPQNCQAASVSNSVPTELLEQSKMSFLALAQDRSSDVRFVAVEALHMLSLDFSDAFEVVSQRALHDCDESVRAAAVRALVAGTANIPKTVLLRARLDKATRVRRALLEQLEPQLRLKACTDDLRLTWSSTLLMSLRDRSRVVRKAATRCIEVTVARNPDGWADELLADPQDVEDAIVPLAFTLAHILRWQEGSPALNLRRQLRCDKALAAVRDEELNLRSAVWARIACVVALANGDSDGSVDAGTAEYPIMQALTSEDWEENPQKASFQLRQFLVFALQAELPPSNGARMGLARAAAAVILKVPCDEAAEALISGGVFPSAKLGARVEVPPTPFFLAVLLLRRLVQSACQQRVASAAALEALFSKTIGTAVESVKKALSIASREKAVRDSEAAGAREYFEEIHWKWHADGERQDRHAQNEGLAKQRQAEAALRTAESIAADAQAAYDELSLRAILVSTAWLKQSNASPTQDPQQQQLLTSVLRPAVADSNADEAQQLPAIHAIAIYASKNPEHVISHWHFFSSLVESQCQRLQDPMACGSQLRIVVRLLEVSLLFTCDAVLLYGNALGDSRIRAGFAGVARIVSALDMAMGLHTGSNNWMSCDGATDLCHLRAVASDRICCLALMGHTASGGAAAKWLLGRLLGFVCGVGVVQSKHDEAFTAEGGPSKNVQCYTSLVPISSAAASEQTAEAEESIRVANATMCTRILRFLAMLPCASPAHADLFVASAEAFFAARLWMFGACSHHGWKRPTPAVRAARLVCTRLGLASAPLAAAGVDASSLQLRVIRSIAAARLIAPPTHSAVLIDALASAALAGARGRTVVEWVGHHEAQAFLGTLAVVLEGWSPTTSAKSVEALLQEVHARQPEEGIAWQWSQEALDWGAGFRHDLASLGLNYECGVGLRLSKYVGLSTQREKQVQNSSALPGPEKAGDKKIEVFDQRRARKRQQQDQDDATQKKQQRQQNSHDQEYRSDELHHDAELGCGADSASCLTNSKTMHVCKLVSRRTGESWSLSRAGSITLGRSTECNIVMNQPAVSNVHCAVLVTTSDNPNRDWRVVLQDLGGTNGTFLNGQKVPRQTCHELKVGDSFALASKDGVEFVLKSMDQAKEEHVAVAATIEPPEVSHPGSQEIGTDVPFRADVLATDEGLSTLERAWTLASESTGDTWPLQRDCEFTLGRRSACDIVVNLPSVSGKHVTILVQCNDGVDHIELQDLGGVNGSFVNGSKIARHARQKLRAEDVITLASKDGPAFRLKRHLLGGTAVQPEITTTPPAAHEYPSCFVTPAKTCVNEMCRSPPEGNLAHLCHKKRKKAADLGDLEMASHEGNDGQDIVAALEECDDGLHIHPTLRRRVKSKRSSKEIEENAQAYTRVPQQMEPVATQGSKSAAGGPTIAQELPATVAASADDINDSTPRLVDVRSGALFHFPVKGVVTIGRRSDCNVVINGDEISGRHCMFLCRCGQVELEDVSSNGTYVNDAKMPRGHLAQRVLLRHGDKLALGRADGPAFLYLSAQAAQGVPDEA